MMSATASHLASKNPLHQSPDPVTATDNHSQSTTPKKKDLDLSDLTMSDGGGEKLTLSLNLALCTPADLIKMVISKRMRKLSGGTLSPTNTLNGTSTGSGAVLEGSQMQQSADAAAQACCHAYVLKVAGFQLFLLKHVPLIQYKYIFEMVHKKQMPLLMLMGRDSLLTSVQANWTLLPPSFIKRQGRAAKLSAEKSVDLDLDGTDPVSITDGVPVPTTLPATTSAPVVVAGAEGDCVEEGAVSLTELLQPSDTDSDARILWEVENMFRVRVCSAGYVNVFDADEIYIKASVFHGTELICARETKRVTKTNLRWNECLDFDDLYIPDIPRAAQVCFSICSVRYRKQKQEHVALAWVNVRLVDYRDRFVDYSTKLHMWPFAHGFDGYVNPFGHTGPNPDKDTPYIEIEFENFGHEIVWPEEKKLYDFVNFLNRWRARTDPDWAALQPEQITDEHRLVLHKVLKQSGTHELDEEERATMWRLREHCKTEPECLPRLLDAVKWSCRANVATTYVMLDTWPLLSPDTALQLLDVKYPDHCVREFAVKCLDRSLCDDRLQLYMMPLVQVLRYEAFLDNPLTKFLLKRALSNQRIGHMFFWLLRSELAIAPQGAVTRFVLILEAFCRGCGPYLKSLMKQTEATEKLEMLSAVVKEKREDGTRVLVNELAHNLNALQNLESPLDSSHILGLLQLNECRVLTSAKRPLWLVWKNPEPLAALTTQTHEIIFKNGDDLRQDMLTLQVLRIMDSIWKAEGYDFCLTPYSCLPMGKNIGMIEVVKHSKTIAEIQGKERLLDAFNVPVSFLNKWVREHNPSDTAYNEAVRKFTMSCAGYSVATFVLGIKDRHQDNIMVTQDGRIFHIDFGHFLGHDKKKLGINRDRVPFVLNDYIATVIAHGLTNSYESAQFAQFRQLCVEAYQVLHKHGRLFISLFTMMLCMGIPELQKLDDIVYLRRTLAVHLNEQQARQYFDQQFALAHKMGWTTMVNFTAHAMKQALKAKD